MIAKDMKTKEKFIRLAEAKIKNKIKPIDYATEESDLYHHLSQLYNIAYLAGELSGIRSCKNILNQDMHELEDRESLGKKHLTSLQ